ncbi:hypothetical protein ACU5B6_26825 [Moritella viscosa]|uniref:hypothetical protein n=1 Tax=Moritella viscosa TaxID=80854 RepID=UPI00091D7BA9|nr:hypothetical protein [Moritella viscosa]SHO14612.1 Uncharacterized protein yhaC-ORF B'-ORFX [Moritella viscosa]SHO15447.1 Uncharacterized protein yhaC-ORF B'-ORFX [Moritella viscosa]SHO17993.1 Uncharacterized protein yhaC-ORF B'-ORFX [Moritella viscosa]SHO18923.1 Uncharacterized protein yhaC-ORF B'-ORFX [Moritella viscosa]
MSKKLTSIEAADLESKSEQSAWNNLLKRDRSVEKNGFKIGQIVTSNCWYGESMKYKIREFKADDQCLLESMDYCIPFQTVPLNEIITD